MRVLITGSRHWSNAEAVEKVVSALPTGSVVIHGGARGADSLADHAARCRGLEVISEAANWSKYGRAAGPIRNKNLLMYGPDCVVAFLAPNSRGTANMIAQAQKAGLPVHIVHLGGDIEASMVAKRMRDAL
jgi:hypothetical protein